MRFNLLLQTKNLTAGYGNIPIIRNIDVQFKTGELTAIIGPNGSGKSTLTKSLINSIRYFSGEIIFDGENITNKSTFDIIASGIALVPQVRNIFPSMTVQENLDISTNAQDKPARQIAFNKIYEKFPRLNERINVRASNLSGGERQMLAIGCALINSPKLIILDEPTTGLSPQLSKEVADSIKTILNDGTSVAWVVEENPKEVLEIAEWVNVMDGGEIRLSDDAKTILNSKDFKKLFLGI